MNVRTATVIIGALDTVAWLAVAAGAAGLEEESLGWMERTVAERDPLLLWSRRMPFWDAMRGHPRCEAVMRSVWADASVGPRGPVP